MAGAHICLLHGPIYPAVAFDPAFDVTVAMMAFLGGLGTVAGPLVGALFSFRFSNGWTLQFGGKWRELVLYGAIILLIILLLLPKGIVPSLREVVGSGENATEQQGQLTFR